MATNPVTNLINGAINDWNVMDQLTNPNHAPWANPPYIGGGTIQPPHVEPAHLDLPKVWPGQPGFGRPAGVPGEVRWPEPEPLRNGTDGAHLPEVKQGGHLPEVNGEGDGGVAHLPSIKQGHHSPSPYQPNQEAHLPSIKQIPDLPLEKAKHDMARLQHNASLLNSNSPYTNISTNNMSSASSANIKRSEPPALTPAEIQEMVAEAVAEKIFNKVRAKVAEHGLFANPSEAAEETATATETAMVTGTAMLTITESPVVS